MSTLKTILITGATGFVGAHLIRHFANTPFYVIALGRTKTPPAELLACADEYFQADIIHDNLPTAADIIIHTAGLASDTAKWEDLKNVNFVGAKRLFTEVKHQFFLHISSASVYPKGAVPHHEEEVIPIDKLNDYGKSKRLAEEFLLSKENVCILRPRAIYGTNDRVILPKILAMKKGPFVMSPCHLRRKVSLTHIGNLVQAIELCISQPEKSANQIFNVTDDDTYILHDIVKSIHEMVYKRPVSIKNLPFSVSKQLSKVFANLGISSKINDTVLDMLCHDNVFNIDKIKQTLGYQPRQNFEQVLPDIGKWLEGKDVAAFVKAPEGAAWG